MFNSTILDVVIGVIFVFLAVSLVTSAMTEALSSALKWRQATLLSGIQALLNDRNFTGLARDVYNHSLVSPLGSGAATKAEELEAMPAYIDANAFGTALIDIISRERAQGVPMQQTIGAIPDPQLRSTLLALFDRSQRLKTHFSEEIGAWFDTSMARLGGWYKRRVQVTSFVVALALSAVLNVDAIHVVATLWDRPVLAAQIASSAAAKAAATLPATADAASPVSDLETRSFLLGWQGVLHGSRGLGWPDYLMMALGWLITAAATLFGAAFWFDLLKNVVQLQGTGRNPASVMTRLATASPALDADQFIAAPRQSAELVQIAGLAKQA
jgi:hypothetical protein